MFNLLYKEITMNEDFDLNLKKYLFRFNCPSSDKLGDFYLDILSESEYKQINQHLSDCSHCKEELKALEHFNKVTKRFYPNQKKTMSFKERIIEYSQKITTWICQPQSQASILRGGEQIKPTFYEIEPVNKNEEKLKLFFGYLKIESGFSIQIQFLPTESQINSIKNGLLEIWQDDHIKMMMSFTDIFSFNFNLNNSSPIILRINNNIQKLFQLRIIFNEQSKQL